MLFPDWVHESRRALGPWLTRLMERGEPYGRFRHADICNVKANAASSSYAVGFHRYLNMLPLSQRQARSWAQWLGTMQDPATGQFIDVELERHLPSIPRHGRSALWNHRRYVTKQAQCAMLLLGQVPEHEIRDEQLGFDPARESIEAHLASFDWSRDPWSGGSAAANSLATLDYQVRRGRHELIPIIARGIAWLEAQQDPTTGLWGAADCHHRLRINSGLKVITRLFSTFRRRLQYPDKVVDSVLANWQDGQYFRVDNPQLNACDEMNSLVLAATALRFTDHRRDEIVHGARQRIEWFRVFRRSDGAFSLLPMGSIRQLNDIAMTDGQDQGDIHGVNLVCNALALIADIAQTTSEQDWRFHGFHYGDWLTVAGCYEPQWDVIDMDTYQSAASCPSCASASRAGMASTSTVVPSHS